MKLGNKAEGYQYMIRDKMRFNQNIIEHIVFQIDNEVCDKVSRMIPYKLVSLIRASWK